MNRTLLVATAALVMSTGAVFAAGPSNDPASQSSRGLNYDSGYVFPDDGSPSGSSTVGASGAAATDTKRYRRP